MDCIGRLHSDAFLEGVLSGKQKETKEFRFEIIPRKRSIKNLFLHWQA